MNSRGRDLVARRPAGRRRRKDEDTDPVAAAGPDLLSIARDVTEQTRKLRAQSENLAAVQQAICEANQRVADLYDFVPIPYLLVSNVGVIQHVNESALLFFGGDREWIIGRPLIAYVDTPDMRRVLDKVLGSSNVSQAVEVRLRARDGVRLAQMIARRRYHQDAAAPVTFHIAIVDLTEIRRLEEERGRAERERERSQQAERLARAASEAKDEFLAMLSHELRTPLTPILAAADSLVAHGSLSRDLLAKLEIIRRNVKVEAHLIDDLLDVARITKNKLDVSPRPMDLHRLLEELLDGWKAPLEQRRVRFGVRLEPQSTWVNGDPARLGQVFRNIISNASKFTDGGGQITITSQRHGGRIGITITDTGAGMTDAQIASLFKPFQPSGEQSARHGLGLGLVISHAIVEAHAGTIAIHSGGPGMGTTVSIDLPVVDAPPPVAAEARAVETSGSAPAAKVLLVEDDRDSAEMLAMLLSLEGFTVESALSMRAALDVVDGCDVLVSDIALPDGSGLELMRQIRATGRPMRGIALSGYGSARDVKRSLDAGFEEHLTKPVDLERLVAAVRRLTEPRS